MVDTRLATTPRRRSSLSRRLVRRAAPVSGTPLPVAHAAIHWLEYECPACGELLILEADLLHEDDAGWIGPEGPDRYPLCAHCETQFECQPVRLMTAPSEVHPDPSRAQDEVTDASQEGGGSEKSE